MSSSKLRNAPTYLLKWVAPLGCLAATLWATAAHASVASDTSAEGGVKTQIRETIV